jgi:hypothetical protein
MNGIELQGAAAGSYWDGTSLHGLMLTKSPGHGGWDEQEDAMRIMAVAAAAVVMGGLVLAQTSPTPGPTRPEPAPGPIAQADRDIVVNPTLEQCRAGWNPTLRWTRDGFQAQCAKMHAAK